MKPELKAYELNTRNLDWQNESIQRGYIDCVCAKTEHDARKQMLKKCYDHGICETWSDELLTYINLKIKRSPDNDRFMFDGKLLTRMEIQYKQDEQKHRDMIRQMLADNPNGYAYILKGGCYYMPNKCGYTERQTEAGIYEMADAVNECLSCSYSDYMRPVLIDVEQHNQLLLEKINQLQSKLLHA